MNPSTDRAHYRETVAAVADKARAILPASVNGRIENAVKLVLNHDIEVLDDGSIEVGSSSDPARTYRLIGTTCECQDFQYAKAPQGWCSHRIAAGIAKRVHELLPPAPAPPAAPLPACEVPAIMSTFIMIEGRQVEVKLCDTDDTRLVARLTALLQQFPVPQSAPRAPTEGWCATHGVQMPRRPGKGGKADFFSHQTPEGWCHGHGGKAVHHG